MTTPEDDAELTGEIEHFLAWVSFERAIQHTNRHVPSDDGYFKEIMTACLQCERPLVRGTRLFRARIMPVGTSPASDPLPIAQMRQPPPEVATSQRFSPEGIPCFYAAFERATAIAELRPWRSADVTVATFTTTRDLRVLDLRRNADMPAPAAAFAFIVGRPVHGHDRFAYLGTQYVAERIKALGIAGLLYDSALGPSVPRGTNVALFSDDALADDSVSVHRVTNVTYRTLNLDTLQFED